MRHVVTWQTPQPLWRERLLGRDHVGFARPDILRFTSDEFMAQVERILADDVDSLDDHLITREELDAPTGPFKLYLPAHQRYYLIGASLVCRTRGLPERKLDVASGETASFVIRRIGDNGEEGFFGEQGWRPVPHPKSVGSVDGLTEERLPLFWMPFEDERNDVTRRLALGLIPVGARERYEAGVTASSDAVDGVPLVIDDDPRYSHFVQTITKPMQLLRDAHADGTLTDQDARESFTIALLDALFFLEANFPEVHAWVIGEATFRLEDLFESLGRIQPWLAAVWAAREALMGIGGADAPELLVATAGDIIYEINVLEFGVVAPPPFDVPSFFATVKGALDDPADRRAAVAESVVPTTASGSTYVARCVYERPNCALHEAPVVSDETVEFQFASFYDPNVPIRPIRVTMPADVSIAGLRKAGKSFQVQMSNALREQVERFTGINDVDGTADPRPDFNLGVICSFSIPIITICALILLMIVVAILNIVFFWIPLLRICLPCKLSGK